MAKRRVLVRLFPTGSTRPLATAPITFLDTRLNLDTGTVDARATLPNLGGRLTPGQFVRAELADLAAAPGVYVPAKAINHGAEGSFVWKVDAQDKAQMQPVTIGEPLGNFVRIDKGLAKGDRVVTEGVLKLQPGALVRDSSALPKRPAAEQ
jgi:RND family efflux transporter MFP subunit